MEYSESPWVMRIWRSSQFGATYFPLQLHARQPNGQKLLLFPLSVSTEHGRMNLCFAAITADMCCPCLPLYAGMLLNIGNLTAKIRGSMVGTTAMYYSAPNLFTEQPTEEIGMHMWARIRIIES